MRPPEEVRRDIVRQWLRKADADMDAAEALLSEERTSLYPSCFHSQQAAEKFLKAYLSRHQVEFPKTHILGELLDLISRIDKKLADGLKDVTKLNPYGVVIRYPGDIPEPTREQAEEALDLAQSVRDAILYALKGLV
ncbi:HEPN domain-containing protein [Candidatus Poribacteria bacterium]|nr:HEPN domain-containing protein [Candidatus Poribacteria bacterium]